MSQKYVLETLSFRVCSKLSSHVNCFGNRVLEKHISQKARFGQAFFYSWLNSRFDGLLQNHNAAKRP